jgi:predicted metalloprotease with PDZ domain
VSSPFFRRQSTLPVMLLLVGTLCLTVPCFGTIRYEVSMAHPEQHLFHVTMTIPEVNGAVTVQMPAWNALYQIRDFSSHLRQVEAFAGTEKASVEKLDKQTWRIMGNATITIRYATYWDEPGPFATQVNSEHAFINPAMILLYVTDRKDEPVHFNLPDVPGEWQAAGASIQFLESMGGVRNYGGDAASYDALVDAPIEAGKFEEFQLSGVKPEIWVVVHGDNWKKKLVESELTRICQYELKLMDGAPFERYTFLLHIGKAANSAGGGMEHANSTAISVPSDEYLSGVAAHEFFHLWNVKRIRPGTLEPVDYKKEQYTRALWFAEGVTSTYGSFTLVRSGIWNKQQFYADLGEQISELEARPANHWQSAEQSSLDAWLEKYPLYNGADESVSYYTKGQILGDLLDILIRDRTNNEKSLDDVLRQMNVDFAKEGKAYRDSLDIRLTAEKVAGGSLEDFFQKYVAGVEALPYQRVLSLAGMELRTVESKRAALGFFAQRDASGALVVKSVEDGGFAAASDLRVGDTILNWNGGEPPRRLERWIYEQKPGNLLRLRVKREEKEMQLQFRLGESKEILYQVTEDAHASERARHIRDGILHGTTQPVPVN